MACGMASCEVRFRAKIAPRTRPRARIKEMRRAYLLEEKRSPNPKRRAAPLQKETPREYFQL